MEDSLLQQNSLMDGKRAWVVAIACSCIMTLTLGSMKAYGEIYAELVSYSPGDSKTIIGLQTVAFATEYTMCSLVVFLNKRFGSRVVLFAAGVATSLGYITSSCVATALPGLLYFTYSLLIGFGAGMAFISTQWVVTQYFRKYIAVASAIVLAGSSVGMLSWPYVFRLLFETYAIRGAFIVIGSIIIHVCCISLVVKPVPQQRLEVKSNYATLEITHEGQCASTFLDLNVVETNQSEQLLQSEGQKFILRVKMFSGFIIEEIVKILRFIKTPNFPSYCLSIVLLLTSLGPSLVLLSAYALEIGLTTTDVAHLMTAAGVGELVGRLFFGVIANVSFFQGRSVILYISIVFTFGISSILGSFTSSFSELMAYAITIGLFGYSIFVINPIIFIDAFGIKGYAGFYAFATSCSFITPAIAVYIGEWIHTLTDSWVWPLRFIGLLSIMSSSTIVLQLIFKKK